jgi:hypothetical protein
MPGTLGATPQHVNQCVSGLEVPVQQRKGSCFMLRAYLLGRRRFRRIVRWMMSWAMTSSKQRHPGFYQRCDHRNFELYTKNKRHVQHFDNGAECWHVDLPDHENCRDRGNQITDEESEDGHRDAHVLTLAQGHCRKQHRQSRNRLRSSGAGSRQDSCLPNNL